MRLKLIPPAVLPDGYPEPTGCPDPGCAGRHVPLRQSVVKPIRDTRLSEVVAKRDQCLRGGRPVRVYPLGVSHDQTRARLKGVAVMFYGLGMSDGAVATARAGLGFPLSQVGVSYAVPEAGAAVPGLRREAVRRGGGRVVGRGADLTSVRCQGQGLTLGVSVDAVAGLALSVDRLDHGEAETLTSWGQALATAVGAAGLVSDAADGFQPAAAARGLDHQVGKAPVVRNTEAWVAAITPARAADADRSLAAIRVKPARAVADCREGLRVMRERPPTAKAAATLARIHRRYLGAPPPARGERASLASRGRLFSLDRWHRWPRLTLDRGGEGPHGERLDGTNNGCERAIGWWVKERYRSMRGDKRSASVLNVSRLIAWMGNALDGPGADLAQVLASVQRGRGEHCSGRSRSPQTKV